MKLIIRSTSLWSPPMGANENGKLVIEGHNLNMSVLFKTNEARWPRRATSEAIGRDWWHSDYKDVSYQHLFAFYNKIHELMGN